jgi:hypothetical protein
MFLFVFISITPPLSRFRLVKNSCKTVHVQIRLGVKSEDCKEITATRFNHNFNQSFIIGVL